MKLRFFSHAALLYSIGSLYAMESADNTEELIYKTLNPKKESRQILRGHKSKIQEKETSPLVVIEESVTDDHAQQVINAIKKIYPTTNIKIGRMLRPSWDQSSIHKNIKENCGIPPEENGPFVVNASYGGKREQQLTEFTVIKQLANLAKHGHIVVKSLGNNTFEYRQPDSELNPLAFETEAKNVEKLLEGYSQEERERFIFVGSLTSDGAQIASYSDIIISPHWANRAIFCPPWNQDNKEKARGTSFSAPIVAASIKMIGDTFQLPYKDATRIIFETTQERQLKREERSNSNGLTMAMITHFIMKNILSGIIDWDKHFLKISEDEHILVENAIRRYYSHFNTVDKIKSKFEGVIDSAFYGEIHRPIIPPARQRRFCCLYAQPELSLEEQLELVKRAIDERTKDIIEKKFLPSFKQYFAPKQEVYTVKILDMEKAILKAKKIAQQRDEVAQLNGFSRLSLD